MMFSSDISGAGDMFGNVFRLPLRYLPVAKKIDETILQGSQSIF